MMLYATYAMPLQHYATDIFASLAAYADIFYG